MSNTFTWKTKFKSIIIVDGELFSNEYNINVSLTPHTADLKEQTQYFDRLKNLPMISSMRNKIMKVTLHELKNKKELMLRVMYDLYQPDDIVVPW